VGEGRGEFGGLFDPRESSGEGFDHLGALVGRDGQGPALDLEGGNNGSFANFNADEQPMRFA
jgi:hypothetical protein